MRAAAAGVAALLLATTASAEGAWLGTRGQLTDAGTAFAFAGLREVGGGYARGDLGAEAAWAWNDRVLELRAVRSWQVASRLAAHAGLTGLLIPDLALDLGLGPHVGLSLALGPRAFTVQLGASSGVEVFARGSARFVERLHLGVQVRVGRFAFGAVGHAGADFAPGHNFTVRTDAALIAAFTP